jgi:prepilin-type N-terminal cleavage/methylation domain-containing protein
MLNQVKQRKQEGFTIIEVLIVLAIAGLIMLVVFLAIPALNRSSHNTQRKSDVSSFLGAVQEFTNNNGGTGPASQADVTTVVGNFKPGFYTTAANYYYTTTVPAVPASIGSGAGSATTVTTENVILVKGAKCTTATAAPTTAGATARNYAVVFAVEGGSKNTYQCQDS